MKTVIIASDINPKMFPFDTELPCLLPVANISCIRRLISQCMAFETEIVVLSLESEELQKELSDFQTVQLIKKEKNVLRQIFSLLEDGGVVLSAELVINEDDLTKIYAKANSVLVRDLDKYEQSTDYICASVEEGVVKSIWGHPRPHYVNKVIVPAYHLGNNIIRYFQNAQAGFHNVNCGQMPSYDYFIEDCLQEAIEANHLIHAIEVKGYQDLLIFPWNISSANEKFCRNAIGKISKTVIGSNVTIDDTCIIKGNLVVGDNVTIGNHVIFEGNCEVGDNVVIESYAIIGTNTCIGAGSAIKNNCKISDNTVIGKSNKIGFNAEISGVTFDSVAAVHNCEIAGVVGKNVDVAAGVTMAIMRFDDGFTNQNVEGKHYKNPYTNNVFIGHYTRTGIGNLFYPGRKVGMQCCLGPGLIVDQDIPGNSMMMAEQKKTIKPWGPKKYGW